MDGELYKKLQDADKLKVFEGIPAKPMYLAVTATQYNCFAVGDSPEESQSRVKAYAQRKFGYKIELDEINVHEIDERGCTDESM